MAPRFTPITFQQFADALEPKGFVRGMKGLELTYEFHHKVNPRFLVLIYTTITISDPDTSARGMDCRECGSDAIRVVLLREDKEGTRKGLVRSRKVLRTGGHEAILERVLTHSRELYREASKWIESIRSRPMKSSCSPTQSV